MSHAARTKHAPGQHNGRGLLTFCCNRSAGASVAALCLYDMCKALSHEITICETHLVKKTGGKSDFDAKRA